MSRKGFFWGLAAGMAVMALLLVLVGGAIWGLRWAGGRATTQTGLRFRFAPGQVPRLPELPEHQDRFGLRCFPGQTGRLHRGMAWGALCCGPVLLLIFGGLAVMALAGARRFGWHCPVCDAIWGGPVERAEDTEAAGETAATEDSAADS